MPLSLIGFIVVLSLERGALQPRIVGWIFGGCQKSSLSESERHLNSEAVILLGWVESEDEAFWIVPLSMAWVTPLHVLVFVQSDFIS